MDPRPDSTAAGIARWRAEKLGLFIHWGPVSQTGQEIGWSRGTSIPSAAYDTLYRSFNPAGFSAREWVDLAKAAGLRYITLTLKHHDGFCLWATRFSPYNVMATPFGRDPAKELAEECRRQGLGFNVYYSVVDRYQPDYLPAGPGGPGYALPAGQAPSMDRYQAYVENQVGEVLERYDPDALWFDGDWDATWGPDRGAAVYRLLKGRKPALVVNDRLPGDREAWLRAYPAGPGDFRTWEQAIGRYDTRVPWEASFTLAQQWSFQPAGVPRGARECLQEMLAVIGGDGNYQIDVGPGPDGRIPAGSADRLLEMGRWITAHAEGIYGTRAGPFYPGAWGASTRAGNRVYLHILSAPGGGRFHFPALPQRVLSAHRLGGGNVEVSQGADSLVVALPMAGADPLGETIALDLEPPESASIAPVAEPVNGIGLPGRWLSRTAAARVSSVYGGGIDTAAALGAEIYAKDYAFHTALEDSPSIVLDLGRLMTVSSVDILNRSAHATANSQLQDFQARARTLTVWFSSDGSAWEEVWRADGARPYWSIAVPAAGVAQTAGGAAVPDGQALGRNTRYIRIGLRERSWLHLANVKVFGVPEPDRPFAAFLRPVSPRSAGRADGYHAGYRADGRLLPRVRAEMIPMVKKHH